MKKAALITGFTRQTDSQMADFLLGNTDYDVIGMMHWQEPIDNIYHLSDRIDKRDRVSIFYADLSDYPSIQKFFESKKPDMIFHLTAQFHPEASFDISAETLQTNIIGATNILESIRLLETKDGYDPVIRVCSSSEVYGRAKAGVKLNEDTTFHSASPYNINKIGMDYLERFCGEAYSMKTYVTRMGTHSGPRRSDVFLGSTVTKQIALIEAGYQEPVIKVGNLSSIRAFQGCRDAIKAYYLLSLESEKGDVPCGEAFSVAGEETFKLPEVIDTLLGFSTRENIKVEQDEERLRSIDVDYQMSDSTKIESYTDRKPEIPTRKMFEDLLNHWREEISMGRVLLNR